ncbi:hypothetical protein, partial [Shigella boydii]
GEYLPGSLQGKISSDACLKKEQMVVSAIASTPHMAGYLTASTKNQYIFHNISHETYPRWGLKKGITFSSAS